MVDKLPLKSKKFLAYMISELGWKICIFSTLWVYGSEIDFYALTLLMCLVITSAFIQVGYILGQAALDKYVHVAKAIVEKDANNKEEKP